MIYAFTSRRLIACVFDIYRHHKQHTRTHPHTLLQIECTYGRVVCVITINWLLIRVTVCYEIQCIRLRIAWIGESLPLVEFTHTLWWWQNKSARKGCWNVYISTEFERISCWHADDWFHAQVNTLCFAYAHSSWYARARAPKFEPTIRILQSDVYGSLSIRYLYPTLGSVIYRAFEQHETRSHYVLLTKMCFFLLFRAILRQSRTFLLSLNNIVAHMPPMSDGRRLDD